LRRLRGRGFFNPSLDGGLPLFRLFWAIWSSNACILAASVAIVSSNRATTASSPCRYASCISSRDGSNFCFTSLLSLVCTILASQKELDEPEQLLFHQNQLSVVSYGITHKPQYQRYLHRYL